MRVLIISDVSSHMVGGVPAETRSLINGLLDLGHEVSLVADAPLSGCERASHWPIRLPADESLPEVTTRAIAGFKPELIHVICMSSSGVFRLAPILKERAAVLTIHSVPPCERKLGALHNSEFLHYFFRGCRFLANSLAWRLFLTLRSIPCVIVHSRFVADIVVRKGFPRRLVAVVPLPYDSRGDVGVRSGIGSVPFLVTVGGIAHTKGQHDVIRALPTLLRRFPGIRYQIIGEVRDESYLRYLHHLCHQLGIRDQVLITPGLSNQEKNAALAAAAVYVQPSHEEGFCLAYIEAATRVPRLVGADAGAIADISRGDAGARVVKPRDPAGIAVAVAELLNQELPADHMTRRIERLAREFSLQRYLQAQLDVYQLVIARNLPKQQIAR